MPGKGYAFPSARPFVCGGGVILLTGYELGWEFVAAIVTHDAPQASNSSSQTCV